MSFAGSLSARHFLGRLKPGDPVAFCNEMHHEPDGAGKDACSVPKM
jgi:hypothetical protein